MIKQNIQKKIKEEQFSDFYKKKINDFNVLIEATPIFPKKILNKFDKYVKHIDKQYIKPTQINKSILSIKTYIDNFENLTIDIENVNENSYKKNKCCLFFFPKNNLPEEHKENNL